MVMPANPDHQNEMIAEALDRVKRSAKVRGWYHQFDDDSRHKTDELNEMSSDMLECSIRMAVSYGYPVEAVAVAASMSVAQVHAVADGSAAA